MPNCSMDGQLPRGACHCLGSWPSCPQNVCLVSHKALGLGSCQNQTVLTLYTTPCLQADSATYQAEKQLKEFGDKVPAEVKSKVEEKIKALREASEQDNLEAMKSGMEALQQEMMSVGQAVYSQVGAAASRLCDWRTCLRQEHRV